MSAVAPEPANTAPAPEPAQTSRAKSGPGWLWAPMALAALFLYLPIAVLVVMSFNASSSPFSWGGASLRWYGELVNDAKILDSLRNTLVVAVVATAIATVLGTTLAVGLARYTRSTALAAFSTAPAILPDLVLGIGLLVLFSLLSVSLGLVPVTVAHSVFGMAFVTAIVRARLNQVDPSLEEASRDLGAGAVSTFFRVTVPGIAPAILAGALLTFTLSIDEFVIAFFTNGPDTPTLPITIYSMVRFGVTPEINALATVLLLVSLVVVLAVARIARRTSPQEPR